MTISTTENRKEYACNGVTTEFSFPYYFLANADLVVLLVTKADGTETTLTLGTDYTLTGAGDSAGGTVTTTTAYASTYELVVYRDPTITQGTDLVENDPLPANEVEKGFDRLTMINQRDRELLQRGLRLPAGDTGFEAADMQLPVKLSRASKYLAFDADGKPTSFAAPAPLADATVLESVAELRATAPTAGALAFIKHHTAAGDGGHGYFRPVTGASASTYTDNNGTIIVPTGGDGSAAWLRVRIDESTEASGAWDAAAARADIGAAAKIAAPTSGNLVSQTAGGDLQDAGVAAADVYKGLLAEYEVTGAAVTSIDFTGLDINTHKSYRIELDIANASTTASAPINMFVNGDTAAANYYSQYLVVDGTATTANRVNNANICSPTTSSWSTADGRLGIVGGYAVMTAQETREPGSAVQQILRSVTKTATVANITQLTFTTTTASAIDVGSRIRIYRGDA